MRKGNAMQHVSLPTKPRIGARDAFQHCVILCLGSQSRYGKVLFIAYQYSTAWWHCSISPATLLNPSGIGAQFGRFWCIHGEVYSPSNRKWSTSCCQRHCRSVLEKPFFRLSHARSLTLRDYALLLLSIYRLFDLLLYVISRLLQSL